MGAFLDGLSFGFASSMFNRMCGGFNPFFGFNSFHRFMPFSCFSFMPMSFLPMNFTWNAPAGIPNSAFDWSVPSGGSVFSAPPIDVFTSARAAAPNNYVDEDTSYFSYDADALKNKWKSKKPNLTDGFYNKVVEISKRIKCDPNDLMGLMDSESGLEPNAVNNSSKATGLIQFMPKTAKGLGTTVKNLASMSAEEQLVYVEKHLMQAKKAAGLGNKDIGAGTLYALVFLPAFANKEVLTRKGESYYSWNPGLDSNKDGYITKSELAERIAGHRA